MNPERLKQLKNTLFTVVAAAFTAKLVDMVSEGFISSVWAWLTGWWTALTPGEKISGFIGCIAGSVITVLVFALKNWLMSPESSEDTSATGEETPSTEAEAEPSKNDSEAAPEENVSKVVTEPTVEQTTSQAKPSEDTTTPQMKEQHPDTLYEAQIVESGKCGDNVMWTLDKNNGLLTVSGRGAMNDYYILYFSGSVYPSDPPPWYERRTEIQRVKITQGITAVGKYAFHDCVGLRNIAVPESVNVIGDCAFSGCPGLRRVTLPAHTKFTRRMPMSMSDTSSFDQHTKIIRR